MNDPDETRGPDETQPAGEMPAPPRVGPGEQFAGHRIKAVLGRGGMGVVYRARHIALDRERALKVLAPQLSADTTFRERFRRESRLAASIEHPNVVPVHHAGEEGGLLYLSMRFVDGRDLHSVVDAEGSLEPARAAMLAFEVAAALDAAHARGLIHRDVKPANVLLEGTGDDERVYLTDFGISRLAGGGGTITASGEFVGSVDYVAPEQIAGEHIDHRVDVYALGCLAYNMLTGRVPFPRENDLARMYAHANAPRPRPTDVVAELSPATDDVVARAMAIDPDDRYDSAGEAAGALGESLGAPAPTPSAATSRAARRTDAATTEAVPRGDEATTAALPVPSRTAGRRRLAVAGGIVALLVAGTLLLVTGGDGDSGGDSGGGSAGTVDATMDVGEGPLGLAVGPGRVWVASRDQGAVYSIDPADRVGDPIQIDAAPTAVATAFAGVWAVVPGAGAVVRVDPAGEAAPVTIPVGAEPSDVAVGEGAVWVANAGSDSVSRIDPDTNQVTGTVPVGDEPHSIAVGDGSVWVTNIAAGSVSRIDPAQMDTIGKPIPVGQRPNDVAVGDGVVWVIDNFEGTLTRIAPGEGGPGEPIPVGSKPRGVKVGFDSVWVANGGDDTVSRLDPVTSEPVGDPIEVGDDPSDVAVGQGFVYVTNFGDSTVTKIEP